jgi:quinol-cytochrome oxidoreductase complex cytochrome b subunit
MFWIFVSDLAVITWVGAQEIKYLLYYLVIVFYDIVLLFSYVSALCRMDCLNQDLHYVPHVHFAATSVKHLMTDVPASMILRYDHVNGVSLFFTVVYMHILRGICYNSSNQSRKMVWVTGVIKLLVMIVTAFIGYMLPWSQMSFWGVTVITNLATSIPVAGNQVVFWL